MRETQESITEWAIETFGDDASDIRILARANEEMAELIEALSRGENQTALAECADVVIVLSHFAERHGFDIICQHVGGYCGGLQGFFCGGATLIGLAFAANRELSSLAFSRMAPKPARLIMVRRSLRTVALLRRIANKIYSGKCFVRESALGIEIDRKMVLNRKRKWLPPGHGLRSHHVNEEVHA